MDTLDEILAHYGVVGMKWGVRRDHGGGDGSVSSRAAAAVRGTRDKIKKDIAERTSTELTVRAKAGRHVQVVGGTKRLPHDDAISARSAEQIAKKNTLDALSNQQLQHLVTRMNLEQQYRNLAGKETRATPGEKFAKKLIEDHGDVAVSTLGPAAPIGRMLLKTAAKGVPNKAMSGGTAGDKKDKKK